ncbi:G-patch domain-containing protein [Syncephalis fuscata]|nr:G-patch domain-containing protein [Syncephalis fuscata]
MGLAGRKVKQRISRDPNNLAWSNNTDKFGFKMLEKMGWAPGKGLGKDEQGVVEHLKVRLKEDQLGVGADKKTVDNWIANSSGFDDVLKRLNGGEAEESAASSSSEEKENKQVKKKMKKVKKDVSSEEEEEEEKNEKVAAAAPTAIRLASRSRFLRNKRVSNYNAKDLAEILGVRTSTTASKEVTESSNNSEEEKEESGDDAKIDESTIDLENSLKTSQLSTRDYFAAKLKTMSGLTGIATANLDTADAEENWEDSRPIMGLGFTSSETSITSRSMASMEFTVASSTCTTTIVSKTKEDKKDKKKEKKDKKEKKEKKDKKVEALDELPVEKSSKSKRQYSSLEKEDKPKSKKAKKAKSERK